MCDCSACSSLGGGVKACCKAFSHCAGSALHTKSRMRSSGNRPLINTGSALDWSLSLPCVASVLSLLLWTLWWRCRWSSFLACDAARGTPCPIMLCAAVRRMPRIALASSRAWVSSTFSASGCSLARTRLAADMWGVMMGAEAEEPLSLPGLAASSSARASWCAGCRKFSVETRSRTSESPSHSARSSPSRSARTTRNSRNCRSRLSSGRAATASTSAWLRAVWSAGALSTACMR
mmetsp:Transcript_2451/g.8806  ORF Transcript_2451/g.8806 Transcript_2451/m.8806 type:complete len:235 (+) Transcript_2451:600-1304(+)